MNDTPRLTLGLPDDPGIPMVMIGPTERLAIETVIAKARATPGTIIGVRIPKGYDAVLSFEATRIGLCIHLSVGMGGHPPPLAAVEMIAAEFGLKAGGCLDFWVDDNNAANLLALAQQAGTA